MTDEGQTKSTTNLNEIKRWAEERGGRPSVIQHDGETIPILRFDFGEKEESLKEISWDRFKDIFESRKLQMIYQDQVQSGETSRFFKFISR